MQRAVTESSVNPQTEEFSLGSTYEPERMSDFDPSLHLNGARLIQQPLSDHDGQLVPSCRHRSYSGRELWSRLRLTSLSTISWPVRSRIMCVLHLVYLLRHTLIVRTALLNHRLQSHPIGTVPVGFQADTPPSP